MKVNEQIKKEMIEIVAGCFETGHGFWESFEDFKEDYPWLETGLDKQVWEYYCELVQMGPVGFYEEFKDVYDFDPMFVEEYGHYYDDDDEEE